MANEGEGDRLTEMLKVSMQISEDLLKSDGSILPTWTLRQSDGGLMLVQTPFESDADKQQAQSIIKAMILAYEITHIAFVSEVYFQIVPVTEGMTREDVKRMYARGELNVERREGLYGIASEPNRELTFIKQIERDENGDVAGFTSHQDIQEQDPKDIEGTFSNLFPPQDLLNKYTPEETEEMRRYFREQLENDERIYDMITPQSGTVH